VWSMCGQIINSKPLRAAVRVWALARALPLGFLRVALSEQADPMVVS
jgi:hypothetical protein